MGQPIQKQVQEKINSFRYTLSRFNEEGWADANKYLPIPFDLVTVWTDTDKKIAAWWDENIWTGFRLTQKDRVLFWQRRKYEHLI